MLAIEQVLTYFERRIAEERLIGDQTGLRHLQIAAGLLMEAAQNAGDTNTAFRFRVLAAEAANKREELVGED